MQIKSKKGTESKKVSSTRRRKCEEEQENGRSSCDMNSCSSDNSSEDDNNNNASPKPKTRATRGSATDPQSLYARVHIFNFTIKSLYIYIYIL